MDGGVDGGMDEGVDEGVDGFESQSDEAMFIAGRINSRCKIIVI